MLNETIIILMYCTQSRERENQLRAGKMLGRNIDEKHVQNINKFTTWNKRVESLYAMCVSFPGSVRFFLVSRNFIKMRLKNTELSLMLPFC